MEKSSVIGLALGIIVILTSMMLKGAHLSYLNNPAAFTVILGGTVASIFMAFPMRDLKKVGKLFKIVFSKPKLIDRKELIAMFMEWAMITRREGLLALENRVEEVKDPFLYEGMRMIIDGNDQEFVRDVLLEDIASMEERHRAGAQIFTQAGTYAPTLGVLGAVIGLIAALANLSDVDQLAQAVAAAFVATLLGIFTGYVLWHPIANKLKRLSKYEVETKLMMVEGLLSIQSGISTIAIQQKLSVFLTPEEREELNRREAAKREAERAQISEA